MELVFSQAAGDDVTPVATANEVVAAFGIDHIPVAETVQQIGFLGSLEDGARHCDLLRGRQNAPFDRHLLSLEMITAL